MSVFIVSGIVGHSTINIQRFKRLLVPYWYRETGNETHRARERVCACMRACTRAELWERATRPEAEWTEKSSAVLTLDSRQQSVLVPEKRNTSQVR